MMTLLLTYTAVIIRSLYILYHSLYVFETYDYRSPKNLDQSYHMDDIYPAASAEDVEPMMYRNFMGARENMSGQVTLHLFLSF